MLQVAGSYNLATIGILGDEVIEVMDAEASQLVSSPDLLSDGSEINFVLGIGKADKRVSRLLDIGRILTCEQGPQTATVNRESEAD